MAPRVAVAPVVVSAPPSDNQESSFTKQLFGNAAKVASVAPVDSRLQVLGVISGINGVAVLSVDGAAAKPYGVGQTVSPGVVLRQVGNEKVIIARDGVEQSLPTPPRVNKSILTIGKSAASEPSPSNPQGPQTSSGAINPPVMGGYNANQPSVGGSQQNTSNPQNTPMTNQAQSPNQGFVNSQGQPGPARSDSPVQNSPQNMNPSQPSAAGSSTRASSPQ